MYNPEKSNYFNPNIEFIFNSIIYEYDIKDAGFNIIQKFMLLPISKIRELQGYDKIKRHIEIGKLMRDDKQLSINMSEKFTLVRREFIEANNISDSDIISVKKDAIFSIKECIKLHFDRIYFDIKNKYTSYIRYPNNNNLEIYYSTDKIDIKGMSDNAVNKHRLFMLQFIKSIIEMIEDKNPKIKRYLYNFINKYKAFELPEEYYLEFNNMSRNINSLFNYQNIIIPFVQLVIKEVE